MRKLLLSMVAMVFTLAISAQVIYSESFDNFTAGSKVASVATNWTTWSNAPGGSEDGTISSVHANSGANSAMISLNNDLVLLLGDSTSGKYELSLEIYVPADSCAYFNVLHAFSGGSSEWSNDVYVLPHDSTFRLFVGGNDTADVAFTFDTWHEVKYIVDCNNDIVSMQLDGVEIFTWPWSLNAGTGTTGLNQIGGMDFYGYDIYSVGNYRLYIDDVKFENILTISAEDLNAFNQTKVFPTLATNQLNILSNQEVKTLKIIDTKGAVVSEYQVNDDNYSVEVSQLAAGLYYAQMNFGTSIAIRKFVKE
jgi:hypothetical protein